METFTTPEPIRAAIDAGLGDVAVWASARSTTTVEVAPARPGHKADVEAAAGTAVRLVDGRLEVRAPKPRLLGLLGKPGSVVVTVELPAGSDVEATTMFGDLRAAGPLARFRAKTHAGDVRVEEGDVLELESSAGDVEVGRAGSRTHVQASAGTVRVDLVEGSARMKSATGEIVVGRVAGDLEATAPYGQIRVREAVSGTLTLTTTYADLEIGIPEGTAARLDVTTEWGRIRNELTRSAAPPKAVETLEVTARSGYGSVTIRRP